MTSLGRIDVSSVSKREDKTVVYCNTQNDVMESPNLPSADSLNKPAQYIFDKIKRISKSTWNINITQKEL